MAAGLLRIVRRWGPGFTLLPHEAQNVLPVAIDLKCRNAHGSALSGNESPAVGCDAVQLAFGSIVDNQIPPVAKTGTVGDTHFVGVVAPGQGSIANGAELWVRVWGFHPAAKLDGNVDVAVGDLLSFHNASLGVLEKMASAEIENCWARALEAYTTNAIAPKKVALFDYGRMLVTM